MRLLFTGLFLLINGSIIKHYKEKSSSLLETDLSFDDLFAKALHKIKKKKFLHKTVGHKSHHKLLHKSHHKHLHKTHTNHQSAAKHHGKVKKGNHIRKHDEKKLYHQEKHLHHVNGEKRHRRSLFAKKKSKKALLLQKQFHKITRGITLDEDKMSKEDALSSVPNMVRTLFQQAVSTKDKAKTKNALEELAKIYARAQTDLDLLTIECLDKKEDFGREVDFAHNTLQNWESSYTRATAQMNDVAGKLTSRQADIEAYKNQLTSQKGLCERNRKRAELHLKLLEKDLPLAKKLRKDSAENCSSPQLCWNVRCQMGL